MATLINGYCHDQNGKIITSDNGGYIIIVNNIDTIEALVDDEMATEYEFNTTLPATVTDLYVDMEIHFTYGINSGKYSIITAYTTSDGHITVDPAFPEVPDDNDGFYIQYIPFSAAGIVDSDGYFSIWIENVDVEYNTWFFIVNSEKDSNIVYCNKPNESPISSPPPAFQNLKFLATGNHSMQQVQFQYIGRYGQY